MRKSIKIILAICLIGVGIAINMKAANPGLSISWVCILNCTDYVDTETLIAQSPDGTNWTIIASVATNVFAYDIVGLADRTNLCYRVAGANTLYGTGDWSNVVCKQTKGRPLKVYQAN
jgi:hypothetical protein